MEPVKRIFTETDIPNWLQSTAYVDLTRFIAACSNSGCETHTHAGNDKKEKIQGLISILDEIQAWVGEIPLRTDPQRFGNLAFRDWGRKLEQECSILHDKYLPMIMHQKGGQDRQIELLHHFKTSFGSFTRIDYGTGHELSFFAYLFLVFSPSNEAISTNTLQAIVFRVYTTYLQVCLKLQLVYRLEPAGSKGVWGLDDFKFLSYLFGASQLLPSTQEDDQQKVIPKVSEIASKINPELAKENLFFMSLEQIHQLKSGPFFEHSPVLYNISQTVLHWSKVYKGLLKMYEKEVLEKWPVVQHFYFGKSLSWTDKESGRELPVNPLALNLALSGTEPEQESDQFVTKAPWAMNSAVNMETKAPWR